MKRRLKNYNFIMAFHSLIVAIILLLELILDLPQTVISILDMVDFSIWLIFVFDYFYRLIKSRNKRKFVKRHIVDLISIIPVYSVFRIFRALNILKLARLSRISQLSKIVRIFTISEKSKKNFESFITTNNFNYTIGIAIIIVLVGAVSMSIAENIKLRESLWWSIVTVTTVGYGDIYPVTTLGRIIATVLMILGIGFIGSLTSTLSTYFIKREKEKNKESNSNKSYNELLIKYIITRLEEFEKISEEDINQICKILIVLKKDNNLKN